MTANQGNCCGPPQETLHVSPEQSATCSGRQCPHGKCRKDGFVLFDATVEDIEEITDNNKLTEMVWLAVSPRRMNYKEEEVLPALAIEKARTLLHEDPKRFSDNLNRYNYSTTEDYGKTIESTINVQKFRDGRIKKTTQQLITQYYPPVCGLHSGRVNKIKRKMPCDPNSPD